MSVVRAFFAMVLVLPFIGNADDVFSVPKAEFAKYYRQITGKNVADGIVSFAVDLQEFNIISFDGIFYRIEMNLTADCRVILGYNIKHFALSCFKSFVYIKFCKVGIFSNYVRKYLFTRRRKHSAKKLSYYS